ncbi:unnamed protein product [Chrysoparadoxa australica]
MTLADLILEAQGVYEALSSGTIARDDLARVCDGGETLLEGLQAAIVRNGVFSGNEEIDDINTEDLPLLATDFYLGSLCLKRPFVSTADRIRGLQRASALLSHYVGICEKLKILDSADTKAHHDALSEEVLSPEQTRQLKTDRYRRQRVARARLVEVSKQLEASRVEDEGGSTVTWDDEAAREKAVLLLQVLAMEALDDVCAVAKERDMLQQMQAMERVEPESAQDSRCQPQHPAGSASEGLQVTRVTSVNGKLKMQRQDIKSGVFQPTVALPTMTLAEHAEVELQQALEAQERQANAPKANRRYEHLLADGDEDDIGLVDEATYHDRDWDEWRSNNPKGIGNKANKRC